MLSFLHPTIISSYYHSDDVMKLAAELLNSVSGSCWIHEA